MSKKGSHCILSQSTIDNDLIFVFHICHSEDKPENEGYFPQESLQ